MTTSPRTPVGLVEYTEGLENQLNNTNLSTYATAGNNVTFTDLGGSPATYENYEVSHYGSTTKTPTIADYIASGFSTSSAAIGGYVNEPIEGGQVIDTIDLSSVLNFIDPDLVGVGLRVKGSVSHLAVNTTQIVVGWGSATGPDNVIFMSMADSRQSFTYTRTFSVYVGGTAYTFTKTGTSSTFNPDIDFVIYLGLHADYQNPVLIVYEKDDANGTIEIDGDLYSPIKTETLSHYTASSSPASLCEWGGETSNDPQYYFRGSLDLTKASVFYINDMTSSECSIYERWDAVEFYTPTDTRKQIDVDLTGYLQCKSAGSAPTTSSAGSVGTFWVDTSDNNAVYMCVAIGTVEPDTTVYTWKKITA